MLRYWLAVLTLRPAYKGGALLIVFEWRALRYRIRKLCSAPKKS